MEAMKASPKNWPRDSVQVMRAQALDAAMHGPGGTGRATAFNFAGSGGKETWVGTVTLKPGGNTGPHHHGRHEVAVYVVKGRSEIRWGGRLEFAADVGPGDVIYFTPFVPHQERNLDAAKPVNFLVVRSDNERIAVNLDVQPAADPERID